jgi:hypothetical protein
MSARERQLMRNKLSLHFKKRNMEMGEDSNVMPDFLEERLKMDERVTLHKYYETNKRYMEVFNK